MQSKDLVCAPLLHTNLSKMPRLFSIAGTLQTQISVKEDLSF